MKKEEFLKACKILKNGDNLGRIVKNHKFPEKELDTIFYLAPVKKEIKKAIKNYAL